MKKDLALTALKRAIALRQPPSGLIHHSDRGSQYCSGDYRKLLADHKIRASMSGKGNCCDNAMVETVFKTIKSELIWRTIRQSRGQADIAIGRCIDGFYNPVRRHSALGYKSPCRFEAEAASTEKRTPFFPGKSISVLHSQNGHLKRIYTEARLIMTAPSGFVGKAFHIFGTEQEISRQGVVVAQADPRFYIVQYFDFIRHDQGGCL
jgi:hypothetical protein